MASQSDIRSSDSSSNPRNPEPAAKPQKTYPTIWHDVPENIRRCDDGGRHDGALEIVTWDTPNDGTGLSPLGWGACVLGESEQLKDKFEVSKNLQQRVRISG